ncbi:MAG TPA: ribosome silencing factor [Thermoanaerobaculia bacterium]|nr:ribosome silencing factor [Thermoanaerobaculia bacterium]
MTVSSAPQTLDSRAAVREAVAAILDTKGEDVRVSDLKTVADFTDWFVFASGFNERQVQAIADRVEERLKEHGTRPLHVEGFAPGQWVLLDYGDFIVHVFLDERRRFYGLERLWGDAPDRTAEFVP